MDGYVTMQNTILVMLLQIHHMWENSSILLLVDVVGPLHFLGGSLFGKFKAQGGYVCNHGKYWGGKGWYVL